MCRLFGYRGRESTSLSFFLWDAPNSLEKQSELDSRNITNHDGWGLGFYQYGKAYLQKRASQAANDFNFQQLCEFIHTDTMIAHVRDATIGDLSDFNTHPFMYENWIGAHNGTIAGFDMIKPLILKEIGCQLSLDIKGTTDSEVLFFLFIAKLSKNTANINDPDLDLSIVKKSFTEALQYLLVLRESMNIDTDHKLNLLVTNGKVMLASRYGNTLCYTVRDESLDHKLKLYKDDFNLHLKLKCPEDNNSIIIASEKMETEDQWIDIPEQTGIAIDENLNLSTFNF